MKYTVVSLLLATLCGTLFAADAGAVSGGYNIDWTGRTVVAKAEAIHSSARVATSFASSRLIEEMRKAEAEAAGRGETIEWGGWTLPIPELLPDNRYSVSIAVSGRLRAPQPANPPGPDSIDTE